MPGTTQAGNLTLRKLPKSERSQLYRELAAGHVLVTLRETFAVAPGINAARVVAVRHAPRNAYGTTRLECILAGRWTRDAFGGVRWQDTDANAILTETATELVINMKRGQVIAIDSAEEPEIAHILSGIENEDSSGG